MTLMLLSVYDEITSYSQSTDLLSLQCFFLKKRFGLLGRYLVPSIIKKINFLLVDSWTTTIYSPLNTKVSIKYFNIS